MATQKRPNQKELFDLYITILMDELLNPENELTPEQKTNFEADIQAFESTLPPGATYEEKCRKLEAAFPFVVEHPDVEQLYNFSTRNDSELEAFIRTIDPENEGNIEPIVDSDSKRTASDSKEPFGAMTKSESMHSFSIEEPETLQTPLLRSSSSAMLSPGTIRGLAAETKARTLPAEDKAEIKSSSELRQGIETKIQNMEKGAVTRKDFIKVLKEYKAMRETQGTESRASIFSKAKRTIQDAFVPSETEKINLTKKLINLLEKIEKGEINLGEVADGKVTPQHHQALKFTKSELDLLTGSNNDLLTQITDKLKACDPNFDAAINKLEEHQAQKEAKGFLGFHRH